MLFLNRKSTEPVAAIDLLSKSDLFDCFMFAILSYIHTKSNSIRAISGEHRRSSAGKQNRRVFKEKRCHD